MALNKEQGEWLKKISKNSENIKKVPEGLLTEEFWLEAVKWNSYAMRYVPKDMRGAVKAAMKEMD